MDDEEKTSKDHVDLRSRHYRPFRFAITKYDTGTASISAFMNVDNLVITGLIIDVCDTRTNLRLCSRRTTRKGGLSHIGVVLVFVPRTLNVMLCEFDARPNLTRRCYTATVFSKAGPCDPRQHGLYQRGLWRGTP
jgi:hypothetical protein